MVLSSVNHSMADPDPAPGSRYGPWSMINNPQPFFNPMTSSPSRLHRPYYVGYHNAPEVDEDYEVNYFEKNKSRSRYHLKILDDLFYSRLQWWLK